MKIKQQIREKFRKDVFERDGYKCVMCGLQGGKMDSHHVTNRRDMPQGGYCKENGITLCDRKDGCHWKAELYSKYNEWFLVKEYGEEIRKYSPQNLYKLIGSSYEIAYKKSERL